MILATLTGEMLVDETYEELELALPHFANLRRQALQGAHNALVKKPGGRPRKEVVAPEEQLAALQLSSDTYLAS